ncbi:MAG: hypothetical protein K1X75_13005 [Leptospirales bacterium]|nr:hypothetical protein [Leptospirales bacterium]
MGAEPPFQVISRSDIYAQSAIPYLNLQMRLEVSAFHFLANYTVGQRYRVVALAVEAFW